MCSGGVTLWKGGMEWESYLSLRQKELSWFQMHQVAGDVQLHGEPNGGNGIGMQKQSHGILPKRTPSSAAIVHCLGEGGARKANQVPL